MPFRNHWWTRFAVSLAALSLALTLFIACSPDTTPTNTPVSSPLTTNAPTPTATAIRHTPTNTPPPHTSTLVLAPTETPAPSPKNTPVPTSTTTNTPTPTTTATRYFPNITPTQKNPPTPTIASTGVTAPMLQVRPSEEQVEEWQWQVIHILFWFAEYEQARQDCVPEGSLNWKDEYGPIVDEILLKLDLLTKDTVDGSLDDHSAEEVEPIIAYARQITDDIASRCDFTPLLTVTPTPDPEDAPAAAEIVAGSRYLRFREHLSKSAHDLFDEFLIRLIEGDRRVDADTLVSVRVKGNSEYIAEMEEFLDEYGAKAIEGLDGPVALICIRVSYLPQMNGEWYVGLITASGLVSSPDGAENCDDVDWVEDPSFVPKPDDDVVLAVPTPAGDLDEEALFEAEIKRLASEAGNDLSDEDVQEAKNAFRELHIDLEDLKRISGLKIIDDGLRRTAHLRKRTNLDPDSARALSGHLASLMEGVRGVQPPIAVGIRITGVDSSEENLTRFIQQDEVHVLTPVDGYDAALCVSRARMFELADVPGIEYIDKLEYPLRSDKVRAIDPIPTSTTDDKHEDIRLCSGYVFFTPR